MDLFAHILFGWVMSQHISQDLWKLVQMQVSAKSQLILKLTNKSLGTFILTKFDDSHYKKVGDVRRQTMKNKQNIKVWQFNEQEFDTKMHIFTPYKVHEFQFTPSISARKYEGTVSSAIFNGISMNRLVILHGQNTSFNFNSEGPNTKHFSMTNSVLFVNFDYKNETLISLELINTPFSSHINNLKDLKRLVLKDCSHYALCLNSFVNLRYLFITRYNCDIPNLPFLKTLILKDCIIHSIKAINLKELHLINHNININLNHLSLKKLYLNNVSEVYFDKIKVLEELILVDGVNKVLLDGIKNVRI